MRRDTPHDLVPDGAQQVGPLGGRDLVVALAPQQHGVIAHRHGVVAHVDHHLVHRDHPDDGAAATTEQYLAARREQPPRHPVGVPDGQHGHGGVGGERVPQAVRDVLARAHATHQRHPGVQRQRGPQRRGEMVDPGPG